MRVVDIALFDAGFINAIASALLAKWRQHCRSNQRLHHDIIRGTLRARRLVKMINVLFTDAE